MLSMVGKAQDAKNCRDTALSALETVFCVPRDTRVEWVTLSSSNRFGQIVQVVRQRSGDNGTKFLMVWSLHCDNLHRLAQQLQRVCCFVAPSHLDFQWPRGVTRHYRILRVSCSRSLFPRDSTPGTSYPLFLFPEEFGELPLLERSSSQAQDI